jgi:hypothetical protein
MSDESEIKELLEVKALADAFVDSSRRSRFIIIVIIFASVLTFIAFWNSQQNSWTRCRLLMADYALRNGAWGLTDLDSLTLNKLSKLWVYRNRHLVSTDGISEDSIIKVLNGLVATGEAQTDTLYRRNRLSFDTLANALRAQADSLRFAVDLCKNREFYSDTALLQYVGNLDRLRTEKVLIIQVPVFGVVSDVNDLGILGGLAFTVILLWFRFSLWQELRNLRLFFEQVRNMSGEKLKTYYHYLAMRQVLTIPKTSNGPQFQPDKTFKSYLKKALYFPPLMIFYESPLLSNRRCWSIIEKGLFVLPLIVQGIVLYHDWHTFHIGEMIGKSLAQRSMIVGSIFFVVILILTVRCLFLSWHTNREWDKAYEQLFKTEQKKETQSKDSEQG